MNGVIPTFLQTCSCHCHSPAHLGLNLKPNTKHDLVEQNVIWIQWISYSFFEGSPTMGYALCSAVIRHPNPNYCRANERFARLLVPFFNDRIELNISTFPGFLLSSVSIELNLSDPVSFD